MCILFLIFFSFVSPAPTSKRGVAQVIEPPRVDAIVVQAGKEVKVMGKTHLYITKVDNSDEKVIRVAPITVYGGLGVRFVALTPGIARLTMTDIDGSQDSVIVIVQKKSK